MNKLKLLILMLSFAFAANAFAEVHHANNFGRESENQSGFGQDSREGDQNQFFAENFNSRRFEGRFEGRERGEGNHEFNEHGFGHEHENEGLDDDDVPAVPEAETYQMLLVGLGVVGYMASRRKKYNS